MLVECELMLCSSEAFHFQFLWSRICTLYRSKELKCMYWNSCERMSDFLWLNYCVYCIDVNSREFIVSVKKYGEQEVKRTRNECIACEEDASHSHSHKHGRKEKKPVFQISAETKSHRRRFWFSSFKGTFAHCKANASNALMLLHVQLVSTSQYW